MLVLDFDGVLMDSITEVAVTVHNAVTGRTAASPEELPPGLLALFLRNRFHVQSIGDALPLMTWCLAHHRTEAARLLRADEYDRLLAREGTPLNERTDRVYAARNRFMKHNPEGWFALHRPFQPLWQRLRQQPAAAWVLLTNKDRHATLELCGRFDLPLSEERVFSGDGGASKTDNFAAIRRRFPQPRYTCVDDSVKNLHDLAEDPRAADCRLRLILAAWGYGGPSDMAQAVNSGWTVATQEDLITLMAGGG